MMKILTCFIPPTEGSAEICGYDIFEHQMEIKRSVGYLSEQNPLYYDMYVREFLLLVAGIHKIERKLKKTRVEEVIALTGLEKEANKKIGTLSKGYKQRVGLAQALIHDPKVLILDEPTTGLDPNQLLEIRNVIKQIGQSKTILLSTHIMQEVEAVCSRVIIINNGRLVADDETKQLSAGGSLEKKFREITANI